MGFGTTFATVAADGLTNARNITGDFAPILAIFVGLGAFAIVVAVFARFVK